MIKIAFTNSDGGVVLERELTERELNFTSKKTDAKTMICTFYYGDEPQEPIQEPIALPVDILGLLQTQTPEQIASIKQFLLGS